MVDWSLGLNRTNPINALMQGMEVGNAFRMQNEDRQLQQQDRDFQRQRILQQDQRQAKLDTRQDAAFGQQQKQWSREEQEFFREGLLREARALRLTPPEQRVAAFRQRVVPVLQQMGVNPEQIEPQLNDEALSDQEIDAFEAQMGGVQQQERGTVVNPGGHYIENGKVMFSAPFAPQLRAVGEGQSLVEIQPGGGGPRAAPELDFGALEQAIVGAFPGTRVTSRTRTPAQNAAADGVPNSYHLTGKARDFVPPQGMSTAQFAATLKSQLPPGIEVIDEGNHVHIEPAPQSGGSRVVAQGPARMQPRPATAEELIAHRLPPDYPAVMTADGLKPLTGAESIEKREDKAEAKVTAERLRAEQAAMLVGTVEEALSKLGRGEAGLVGQTMAGVGGTRAKDLAETLQTIKANLGFQELAAMRAASPTGGALGAIAVQELNALQATVASLDQGQSEAQLRANLNKIKMHYQRWLDAVEGRSPSPPPGAGRGGQPAQSGGAGRGGRGGGSQPARRPSLDQIFK